MDLRDKPIGIFDSGVGGLTVVKQIQKLLPNEDLVYFGDTARVPYGTKSKEAIIRFSIQNAAFLLKSNIKFLVVACNSSSSYALPSLRRLFKIPIIGVIKPVVKQAVSSTANGCIGIIGTRATVSSLEYPKQIKRLRSDLKVKQAACPLFVPLAEEGWMRHKVTRQVALEYLSGFKRERIDTLILGCTHYPLLKSVIKDVMGKSVRLMDSAYYTALEIKSVLQQKDLSAKRKRAGTCKFFVSDEPEKFAKIGKGFLGRNLKSIKEGSADV